MNSTTGILLTILFIGIAVAVVVSLFVAYDQTAEAGRVTWHMTKAHVLTAYGDPAEVKLTGFGPFQREVWIYRDPFRTVTFDQYGRVIDWAPK
jgi:hypothetical protein